MVYTDGMVCFLPSLSDAVGLGCFPWLQGQPGVDAPLSQLHGWRRPLLLRAAAARSRPGRLRGWEWLARDTPGEQLSFLKRTDPHVVFTHVFVGFFDARKYWKLHLHINTLTMWEMMDFSKCGRNTNSALIKYPNQRLKTILSWSQPPDGVTGLARSTNMHLVNILLVCCWFIWAERSHLLFQACRYGHVQHLEHLLFYGADMSAQNASGNTALHVCALYNQVMTIYILLFVYRCAAAPL